MREPQVVRMARVQRMSLCAIGIPVSGAASPRALFASASRAQFSAWDASTLINALSASPWRSMRSRQARVSSTEEIFLAASAAPSSPRVAFSKLLDDLRHEVEAFFHRRGDSLIKLALVLFARFVGTQALDHIEGVRHRLDA